MGLYSIGKKAYKWDERWWPDAGDGFLVESKRKPGPELPRVEVSQANPVIEMGGERLLETWTAPEKVSGLFAVRGPCLHSVAEAPGCQICLPKGTRSRFLP